MLAGAEVPAESCLVLAPKTVFEDGGAADCVVGLPRENIDEVGAVAELSAGVLLKRLKGVVVVAVAESACVPCVFAPSFAKILPELELGGAAEPTLPNSEGFAVSEVLEAPVPKPLNTLLCAVALVFRKLL